MEPPPTGMSIRTQREGQGRARACQGDRHGEEKHIEPERRETGGRTGGECQERGQEEESSKLSELRGQVITVTGCQDGRTGGALH